MALFVVKFFVESPRYFASAPIAVIACQYCQEWLKLYRLIFFAYLSQETGRIKHLRPFIAWNAPT